MKTDKDYTNRLPEHQEPLRITEHDSAYTAPAPANLAAGRHGRHRGAWLLWGALTFLAVAVLIGSVYWFSGHGRDLRYNTYAQAKYKGASPIAYYTQKIISITDAGDGESDSQNNVSNGTSAYDTDAAASSAAVTASSNTATQASDDAAAEVIEDVVYLFPLNGSEIANNADLNELAEQVAENGDYVTVTAYTDESGRAAYNQQLSERRAAKVGAYLVAHGVPADHIKTVGKGQTHAYPTIEQNRRAEVHVIHS